MVDEKEMSHGQSDDLPQEAVEAAKRQSRINALILAITFLLTAVLPSPWSAYAPLLFVIPLIFSIVNRVRQKTAASEMRSRNYTVLKRGGEALVGGEPYTCSPRDPKDPRRYRPIG